MGDGKKSNERRIDAFQMKMKWQNRDTNEEMLNRRGMEKLNVSVMERKWHFI